MTLPRRNRSKMREKAMRVGGKRKETGNKGRGEGGGKRIASVGPALSLIASSLLPLKIHRENFVPPSPKDTLYTGHALKLMAALFDYIAL